MKSRYFIIFTILSVLGCCFVSEDSAPALQRLYHLGYLVSVELLLFLFASYKTERRRFSYSFVFVTILFIFHFGQLVLYTFFQGVWSHIRFLYLLSAEEAAHGFLYMTYAFTAICIGSLTVDSGKKLRITPKQSYYNTHCDWIKVAKTIIYWTFWVKVALDITTLVITLTSGGQAARLFVNRFPNVFLYYGKISLVGFVLLIFAYRDYPKKQLRTFLFIEGYILVMMISGIRSENVAYLVIFFFAYLATRSTPLKIRTIILAATAAVLIMPFIVAIGQFRTASTRDMGTLTEIYSETEQEGNSFFGLLDTCGDTGYTCQAVINGWLPRFGPTWGVSYYTGIFAVIPNIPGVIDPGRITNEGTFALKLQESGILDNNYFNIGGSLIGELFMNWGIVLGLIVSLFFGAFIGWVSKGLSSCFINSNFYGSLLYIPIMLASLYWVRSYFGGVTREAVWGILFAYLVARNQIKKL